MDKLCSRCGETKPEELFSMKNKALGTRQACCKDCKNKYNKAWYLNNKDSHILSVERNRSSYRDRYNALMMELKSQPCADCGGTFPPIAMDFDHIEDNKVKSVSRLSAGSIDRLMTEIEKCEVVCSNCHRVRTHNRRLRIGATS